MAMVFQSSSSSGPWPRKREDRYSRCECPPALITCREKKGYDTRVYALAPQSIQLLEDLGAWKYIKPRSQPYTDMQVWDHEGPGVVKFSASESGLEELGRLAEDSTIQAALYQTLDDKGFKVDRIFGSTVTSLRVREGFVQGPAELTISPLSKESSAEQTRHITARLVIGADGAMSPVRKLAGISSWGWNYGQEGLVCTVQTEQLHTTAWQHYLKTGPLALLPLWQEHEGDQRGHSSIVWSVPVSEAQRLKQLDEKDFLQELNTGLTPGGNSDKWSVFEPNDGMVDSSKGVSPSITSTPLSAIKRKLQHSLIVSCLPPCYRHLPRHPLVLQALLAREYPSHCSYNKRKRTAPLV